MKYWKRRSHVSCHTTTIVSYTTRRPQNLGQHHMVLFLFFSLQSNYAKYVLGTKYSLRLTPIFLFFKITVTLEYQCSIYYFFHYNTLIYWTSSNLTIPLTTINKGILVNDTNFTIKINTINHFLNNHAQTLNNYYLETEGVVLLALPW